MDMLYCFTELYLLKYSCFSCFHKCLQCKYQICFIPFSVKSFTACLKNKSDVILYVHVSWITYFTAVLCISLQQFVALSLIDTTQFPLHIKFCKAFIHLRRGSLKPCSLFYEVRLRHVLILVSSYCMLTFDVETLHFNLLFLF